MTGVGTSPGDGQQIVETLLLDQLGHRADEQPVSSADVAAESVRDWTRGRHTIPDRSDA